MGEFKKSPGKALRKICRIEEISSVVWAMSDDEAYYWFAKCTGPG